MPRHATSLGTGNFPAASKLMQRYEQEKAYKMHQQKMSNMRHRLDTDSPKKYNHLLLRLKQVQKDEERQAQIDYENKLLLTKMTSIMKYGGSLDNYNNYEIRSLNYPHRNKVNEEILRENIGIAKRLETVKPQYRIDKWEKEYQQHAYLKRLWSDSIKDYGDYSPRRMSRLSKAVKRSMDDSLDEGYREELESQTASEDKKRLPKLGSKHKAHLRATQSETDGPVTRKGGAHGGTQGGTKLPKIIPHKHLIEHDFSMYYSKDYDMESERIKRIKKLCEEKKKEEGSSKYSVDKGENKSHGDDKKNKQTEKSLEENANSLRSKEKDHKKDTHEGRNKKEKKTDNALGNGKEDKNRLAAKNTKMESKSVTSVQSVNVAGNDLESVKTLISEENERETKESEAGSDNTVSRVNQTSEDEKTYTSDNDKKEVNKDDVKSPKEAEDINQKVSSGSVDEFFDEIEAGEGESETHKKASISSNENMSSEAESKVGNVDGDVSEKKSLQKSSIENSSGATKDNSENGSNMEKITTQEEDSHSLLATDEDKTGPKTNSVDDDGGNLKSDDQNKEFVNVTSENITSDEQSTEKTEEASKNSGTENKKFKKEKQTAKGTQKKKTKEDGTSGATGKEDTTDVAQLFKIAKQLGRPEDIFIKTLIKKTHKQRMVTKAKFRQKYDLDLISELKTGLGLQWELLIKELLEDRGFADALAVFDAMCDLEGKKTVDVSDVVEILCTRNNAAMSELKESYRKEFSLTLEEDIMDRTQDAVQTLLLALQKGERDETTDPDPVLCHDDAVSLYESGEDRWTSEHGVFMKLITEKSPQYMQCVLNEFKLVSGGHDILDVMKDECPKDFFLSVKTYVNCTRSPTTYFAEKLHANKIPSNPVFVATLVARSEIDMPAIRKAYKKKYHIDLVEDIKNSTYPTTKCLMELASKVPPVKKDNLPKRAYTRPQPTQQSQQSQPQSQAKKGAPAVKAPGAQVTHKEPQQQKTKAGTQQPQQATKSKQEAADNQAARVAAGPKESVKNNGTVKPASNFNAEEDCDKLNRAMSDDGGADESVVVAIIPKRSNKQRQEIKKVYEQKYKKNLMIDLESELQGDMEEIVFALLMTPTEYDAYCVHKAVEEMGTSEATLIGILCTRSSKELRAIKDYYKQAYKSDMDMDISGDCRGDFGDLVMALCKTERDPGSEVNREQAKSDAQELYKNGSLDMKGELFKTLLTKRNHAQVNATFMEYQKLAGHDIYTAMTNVMQDDDEGYIGVAKAVGDPVLFYTEATNSCFTPTGTNDNMLIRLVVPRSEIDLLDIKGKYIELYGKGLWDVVNREVKGSYKNLLLAVINK